MGNSSVEVDGWWEEVQRTEFEEVVERNIQRGEK